MQLLLNLKIQNILKFQLTNLKKNINAKKKKILKNVSNIRKKINITFRNYLKHNFELFNNNNKKISTLEIQKFLIFFISDNEN